MAYITTPIYYVNDDPHIGHIFTTTSADALSRWNRLSGIPAFMLTGTDEHAAKVVEAAQQRGLLTSDWAAAKSASFRESFLSFDISPSDFIRTSEPRHIEQVSACLHSLLQSGDIYSGEYEGWYDAGQEEYVSNIKARQCDYRSPINRKPLVRRKESSLFFRLSAYESEVRSLIESDALKIHPHVRKEELLARLRDGLRDIPCSRPRSTDWGIAVPGFLDQTVYVWIDALFNYLTAVNTDERHDVWPPTRQIVGKDILWFHAVIWPALLLALRKTPSFSSLELPRVLHAHSFWVRDGEKMSKSMGNFVSLDDLNTLREIYGVDGVRFFLLAAGPSGASDTDFSTARLHEIYTAALSNTVGNCCSRVTTMIAKYCRDGFPQPKVVSGFPITRTQELIDRARSAANDGELPMLIDSALSIFRLTDAYIHESEPFRLAKDPSRQDRADAILFDALEAIRLAATLLWPIMPRRMETVWEAIGFDQLDSTLPQGHARSDSHLFWGGARLGKPISALPPLFPRVEPAALLKHAVHVSNSNV